MKLNFMTHTNISVNLYSLQTLSLYEGAAKKLLEELKFNHHILAGRYINKWISNNDSLNDFSADYYIPVPSFKNKRNFNILDIIFKGFFQNYHDIYPYALRTKNTTPLNKLNKKEREKELRNCFEIVNGPLINNKKICVYDDILTSGSTLKELVKELKKYEPLEIRAVCMFYKSKN